VPYSLAGYKSVTTTLVPGAPTDLSTGTHTGGIGGTGDLTVGDGDVNYIDLAQASKVLGYDAYRYEVNPPDLPDGAVVVGFSTEYVSRALTDLAGARLCWGYGDIGDLTYTDSGTRGGFDANTDDNFYGLHDEPTEALTDLGYTDPQEISIWFLYEDQIAALLAGDFAIQWESLNSPDTTRTLRVTQQQVRVWFTLEGGGKPTYARIHPGYYP